MRADELLRWSREYLADFPEGNADSAVLLKSVLGVSSAGLIARQNDEVDGNSEKEFIALIKKRHAGMPTAYLTGNRQFWALDLFVDSRVLIPRHETETLVECVLDCLRGQTRPSILELGTGSGAVALALASELPKAKIMATDLSDEALEVAGINLQQYDYNNVTLQKADWFDGLEVSHFDLVCSNPPYIASDDSHLQSPELRCEPRSALAGGPDGLNDLRTIINRASNFLVPSGWLVVEHGYNQGPGVREMFETERYADIEVLRDLGQRERVARGRKSPDLRN